MKKIERIFKKKAVKPLCAFLAVLMAVGVVLVYPGTFPGVNAETASVKQKQEELAALEKTQQELLGKINALSEEEKETAAYKADLDYLVSTVSAKIETANVLIEEINTKISETEQAIIDHEAKIEETTEKFKERMRANHEAGAVSYFSILVGAEDIGDFLSRVERVNAMMEYDKNLQAQYEAEKAELEQQKSDLIASKELQEKTLAELESDKAESERLAADAQNYIDSLQADKSSYEAEYQKAKAAEAALDAEIEELLRARQSQNSQQVTAEGDYMWPLPVGKGYISCQFGGRDPNGAPHYALDIANIGNGCPIYATNSGTVVKAEWHYSYGYYVLIDHGGGVASLYAHCSGLAVGAGSSVTKGQTIAYAGSTGFSTGVHLHFEIRVNGSKVNPLNYMAAGC